MRIDMHRTAALVLVLVTAVASLTACARTGTGASVRADVTAQMQAAQAPLQQCYATALQANRRVKGTLVVNFVAVADSGKFDHVTLGRNEPADNGLARCVMDEVAKLKLQTPQRTAIEVAYPIRFTPNN